LAALPTVGGAAPFFPSDGARAKLELPSQATGVIVRLDTDQ
jgi:hypothetical protein